MKLFQYAKLLTEDPFQHQVCSFKFLPRNKLYQLLGNVIKSTGLKLKTFKNLHQILHKIYASSFERVDTTNISNVGAVG